MKNYLIISNDYITINSFIDKILKDNKLTEENIIKYDFNNTSLNVIIEDLNTYGFLIQNKVIICEDAYFLGSKKQSNDGEEEDEISSIKSKVDLTPLERYINNPNPSNILILINDKQDKKKKINKLINEKFIIFDKQISIEDKIKDSLQEYKMNYTTMNYLMNICSNENERILNELEKLKMYKLEEKEITSMDIDKIVIKNLDDDIFAFMNTIIKKDKKRCFELYKELINKGEPLVKLLIMIADQFRLIYNTKILVGEGKSIDSIANMYGIHSYRVKLANEASFNFTSNQLLFYLKVLSDIDKKLKSSSCDKELVFESFILNL